MKNDVQIFNIADLDNKIKLMKETITIVSANPDLGFVTAHLISSFIDGLVAAPIGQTREEYLVYLKKNFPELCSTLGAGLFYDNLRNKAIHEFAVLPPLALKHEEYFEDKDTYADIINYNGTDFICLNIDRLTRDFLQHLEDISNNGN